MHNKLWCVVELIAALTLYLISDIDGSAFKQLILTNAGEEDKNQTWLSNTQNKEDSAGKVGIGVTNE